MGSPWPLLLCRRKKSLLLSVTQSFRAFFSRTSSGFSHIIVQQGGDRRKPSVASVLSAGGGCKVSCARPRSYSGGFSGLSMLILRSRQLQGSGFLASRLLPHARFTAAVHTVQDRLVERMTHSAVASGSRSCSEWRGFIFYE